MKVYLFTIEDNKLEMCEFEVKETPKMYKHVDGVCAIKKENINCAVAHGTSECANRCFLTENNPDKAMEILIKQNKLYIEWMNNKYKERMMKLYKR